jgi:3-oxoacyl-[acyl-carrier-protein] synthase-3
MQQRLGLRISSGALDFNLGCSGFVYGLSLAEGLIRTDAARRILLITAETYSKYIHPNDRSLRTIFGDGAAATLIESVDTPTLSSFQFGTDGRGADTLFVAKGGLRPAEQALKPRHRQRWSSELYMDGPSLISFSVAEVPKLVEDVLQAAGLAMQDIDLFVMHQATKKMLDHLMARLDVTEDRMPIVLRDCGNTVSSTIPIVIDDLRSKGRIVPDSNNLLIGFGVGWSWAGCVWRDIWPPAG